MPWVGNPQNVATPTLGLQLAYYSGLDARRYAQSPVYVFVYDHVDVSIQVEIHVYESEIVATKRAITSKAMREKGHGGEKSNA